MSFKNVDIEKILPNNQVHWKLIFCPKRRLEHNEYRISIELNNKKRQYTCVCFEELFELLNNIPIEKRCFYEHISRGDAVKFYLDYEYDKNHRNNMIDVNKGLLFIQEIFINAIETLSNNNNKVSIDDMVILESSSSKKESYHIILDNDNIRFSNNHSVCVFIKEVFRIILLAAIDHECLRNKNYINKRIKIESSLLELIDAFKCVWLEWFGCVNCRIKNMKFSIADVCNLFVHDINGCITSCIDLKVDGIEQDFRMFMCTKRGEKRPLRRSRLIETQSKEGVISLFHTDSEVTVDSMKVTLQRSLITESTEDTNFYVQVGDIWKWANSIGVNMNKKTEKCIEYVHNKETKIRRASQSVQKSLADSEDKMYVEAWTNSYLKSIGSSGRIHSINTGKHEKFIMCNIRNMDVCHDLHEDYFNDSTIYINLIEKLFSLRCNRIPCNKKSWVWKSMT